MSHVRQIYLDNRETFINEQSFQDLALAIDNNVQKDYITLKDTLRALYSLHPRPPGTVHGNEIKDQVLYDRLYNFVKSRFDANKNKRINSDINRRLYNDCSLPPTTIARLENFLDPRDRQNLISYVSALP